MALCGVESKERVRLKLRKEIEIDRHLQKSRIYDKCHRLNQINPTRSIAMIIPQK